MEEKRSKSTHYVTLKAIRSMLSEVLPKDGEAWLYGSRARGDAKADSDWDVLVLLNKDRVTIDDDLNITMRLKNLGYDFNQEINPQLFTVNDWNSYAFTTFNHNVMADRVRIA